MNKECSRRSYEHVDQNKEIEEVPNAFIVEPLILPINLNRFINEEITKDNRINRRDNQSHNNEVSEL